MGVSLISIIVLAAGEASRFGSPKQLAEINERSLLHYVSEKCEELKVLCRESGHAATSVLVLGAHLDPIMHFLQSVPKLTWDRIQRVPDWEQGMGRSIAESFRSQLEHYEAERHAERNGVPNGAILVLADQPKVSALGLFQMLRLGLEKNDIICASYPNSIGPPAYFPEHDMRAFIKQFDLCETWQGGAKRFIQERVHEVVDIQGVLDDIDTPSDLDRISMS